MCVSLLVQLLLLGFHFGFQRGNFLFILFNLAAFIFNSYTAAFQGTENIFERFILFTDLFFGLIDDIVRKSKLGRNGECITFPGNTDQQAVGRAERSTSNSQQAFSTPEVESAYTFSSL